MSVKNIVCHKYFNEKVHSCKYHEECSHICTYDKEKNHICTLMHSTKCPIKKNVTKEDIKNVEDITNERLNKYYELVFIRQTCVNYNHTKKSLGKCRQKVFGGCNNECKEFDCGIFEYKGNPHRFYTDYQKSKKS